MKKLVFGMLSFLFFGGIWGQTDTLRLSNRRAIADTIFKLLDKNIYGNSLIDRSLTEDSLLIRQLRGNFKDTANAWSWLQAYSDISISYIDSNAMFNDTMLIHKLEKTYENYEIENEGGTLFLPFGLLLHSVSKIDTQLIHTPGAFSNQLSQLKLNPAIDEDTIYRQTILKEAALLFLYDDHGYDTIDIIYEPTFISLSPGISLISLRLNVGEGYEDFSLENKKIRFIAEDDYQVGKVAIRYKIEETIYDDTLSFYLTGNTYKFDMEKSSSNWDVKRLVFNPASSPLKLKYAILYGCDNILKKIRRPIIIAPPYRPRGQPISFKKYFDQFNFKDLIVELSQKGYDVIFIKEKPGNHSISIAGDILADFLIYINTEKKANFPNEDWENTVLGFSAGGQQWRWALKKIEKKHMDQGTPHHHTRLYIPFDSPNWGANVPLFAQSVFYDFNSTWNIQAAIIYTMLKDGGSRSMLINHMTGSTIVKIGITRTIYPNSDVKRMNIMYNMENSFNHQFTPLNDVRKSFPTFTRNIAVSVGHNSANYNTQYGLSPLKNLFSQNATVPTYYGFKKINRKINASNYSSSSSVFNRKDIQMVFLVVPVVFQRHYRTYWAYEWDMAQGGYKNEFYDGLGTSPISVLRFSGLFTGTKHYGDNPVSFLPLVSALAINPTIWNNNNLYFNPKNEGLMYRKFNSTALSNTFGYPHLGRPTDHFQVTPFEAIYSSPVTSEHIKMQKSAGSDPGNNNYLVALRNFILNEVEADTVYLQNKIIGKNHIQNVPAFRYKAWYKAKKQIVFGDSVTPKTNIGAYVIESTGDVTAYACDAVVLKPGFHIEDGGKFHAFIGCSSCEKSTDTDYTPEETNKTPVTSSKEEVETSLASATTPEKLNVFPNPSKKGFTVEFSKTEGEYFIVDMTGELFRKESVETPVLQLILPKGIYIIKWIHQNGVETQKIIAL